MGKKTANSIEGKTMRAGGRLASVYIGARMSLRPAVLAAALASLLLAAPAHAGCGGTVTSRPTHRLGAFVPPLMIGDSVLLGAVPQVARLGFEVNTRGCRMWDEGAHIVFQRKRNGTLPHLVGMFLGADWTVSVAQIRKVMAIMGPKRVLVLVTPRELGGKGGTDAEHEREVARKFPTRVLLLDWVRFTAHHDRWFAPDGLHLGYGGAAALARLLKRAVPYAAPKTFPGPKPPEQPTQPGQPAR
jgi:hypothetical protein